MITFNREYFLCDEGNSCGELRAKDSLPTLQLRTKNMELHITFCAVIPHYKQTFLPWVARSSRGLWLTCAWHGYRAVREAAEALKL